MRIIIRLIPVAVVLIALFSIVQAQDLQAPVPVYTLDVVSERPHDPQAFTQGLLMDDGVLYESTGNPREYTTSIRKVDPQSGEVLQLLDLGDVFFGEGLALVDERLIQLTWTDGIAYVYDADTFEQVDTYSYDGEGWGLCYDGGYIYMSNGSSFLSIRDPETFDLLFKLAVTYKGTAVELLAGPGGSSIGRLNELECVGDYVYANVYPTELILQIDKTDGRVVGVIDASGLLTTDERAALVPGSEVLNGIAYDPEAETFLLTGKAWPRLFEVRFKEIVEEPVG